MLGNKWEKHQDKSDWLPPSPPPRIDDKELAEILKELKKICRIQRHGKPNQS